MAMPVTRMQGRFSRGVGVATMLASAAGVAGLLIDRALPDRLALAAAVCLIGLIGYAAMWAPYVEMRDDGVELRNVLNTVLVPWPAIRELDGRYGLKLETPERHVTSWSASAPAGRARGRVQVGPEAAAVQRQLERQRALAEPGPTGLPADPTVRWHPEVLGVGAVLLVALGIGLLLG